MGISARYGVARYDHVLNCVHVLRRWCGCVRIPFVTKYVCMPTQLILRSHTYVLYAIFVMRSHIPRAISIADAREILIGGTH